MAWPGALATLRFVFCAPYSTPLCATQRRCRQRMRSHTARPQQAWSAAPAAAYTPDEISALVTRMTDALKAEVTW